jgi:hypothetical protein
MGGALRHGSGGSPGCGPPGVPGCAGASLLGVERAPEQVAEQTLVGDG